MNTKSAWAGLLAVLVLVGVGVAIMIASDDHHGLRANTMDAAFVNDMTIHHDGAIAMARLAQRNAEHPQIRSMADEIIAAQQSEIDRMMRLRDEMEGMHTPGMHDGHMGMSADAMGMGMDIEGMADARPFDRAFLDAMIPHHRGAVAMARALLAKGVNPTLRAMAQAVIDSQGREITQMHMWREQWYGAGDHRGRASR